MNDGGFKSRKRNVVSVFVRVQFRNGECRSIEVSFFCKRIYYNPSGITQPVEFGNFIEGFSDGIVNSSPQNFKVVKSVDFANNAVSARNKQTQIRIAYVVFKMGCV